MVTKTRNRRNTTAASPAVVSNHREDVDTSMERAPRARWFSEDDYPQWQEDVPPWRNPDPKGSRYLFVSEQHGYRVRGHH